MYLLSSQHYCIIFLMDKIERGTEHIRFKLEQLFIRDGYRPARPLSQSYNVTLKNGAKAYALVNCFGHACFNLQNEQLNDYKFENFPLYGNFRGIAYEPQDKAVQRMLEFIRATGLQVEDCDPKKTINEFKSWKIGIYFEDNKYKRDFHVILEGDPCTSKIGFEPCVEGITGTLPTIYYNLLDDDPVVYELYNTYKITNPNASVNNRYLKKFRFNSNGYKPTSKQQQFVIEDARENTYEKMLENFCAARGLI